MPLNTRDRFLFNYSLNFISSIGLIGLCKWLFRHYPISSWTLTISNCLASSFVATLLLRCVSNSSSTTTRSKWSFPTILIVAASFAGCVLFSNLSLQYNSIRTYQMMKFQVSPMLMFIEWIQIRAGWNSLVLSEEKFSHNYSSTVFVAFGMIVCGTLISTFSDLYFHSWGFFYAFLAVIFNALYQNFLQTDPIQSTYERVRFLQIQMILSGFLLIPFWLLIDPTFSFNQYLVTYWHSAVVLSICAVLAFFVNTSVLWCIKDETSIGYNSMGPLKTLVIVLVGSIVLREQLSFDQVIGILITTAGCLLHVYMMWKNNDGTLFISDIK